MLYSATGFGGCRSVADQLGIPLHSANFAASIGISIRAFLDEYKTVELLIRTFCVIKSNSEPFWTMPSRWEQITLQLATMSEIGL